MKKIINGKRYDTNTAKEVAEDSYGNTRDFSHWIETLYRKNTGEYFLHGIGGPMSRYAVTIGQNEWSGGEKIIPLTVEAARKWAEEHVDGDEFEKIFGEIVEDESKKVISLSLPTGIVEMIKRGAAEENTSMSGYIARLVEAAQK